MIFDIWIFAFADDQLALGANDVVGIFAKTAWGFSLTKVTPDVVRVFKGSMDVIKNVTAELLDLEAAYRTTGDRALISHHPADFINTVNSPFNQSSTSEP